MAGHVPLDEKYVTQKIVTLTDLARSARALDDALENHNIRSVEDLESIFKGEPFTTIPSRRISLPTGNGEHPYLELARYPNAKANETYALLLGYFVKENPQPIIIATIEPEIERGMLIVNSFDRPDGYDPSSPREDSQRFFSEKELKPFTWGRLTKELKGLSENRAFWP